MVGRIRRLIGSEAGLGGRVVAIGLVLALLTMPVNYRAGTDRAHPHSFVQFLIDASHGSMNHHLVRAEPTSVHAAHAAVETPTRPLVGSTPIGAPAFDQLGPANERFSVLGLALLAALVIWAATRANVEATELTLHGRSLRPASPPPRRLMPLV